MCGKYLIHVQLNIMSLCCYLNYLFFFSARYLLKLSHSEDYFKEEEKFRVDENKR